MPASATSRRADPAYTPSFNPAYLAAGRPRVYFGPYLLLQTLGEGEFGKVKLGVHSERCVASV